MKNSLPIALLALLLSLVALGAGLRYGPPAPNPDRVPRPTGPDDTDQRLDQLVGENTALRLRVESLEMALANLPNNASVRTEVGGEVLGPDELERVVAEVREALQTDDAGGGTSAFTSKVASSLKEIRLEDARAKAPTAVARRTGHLAKRLPEVAAELELSSYQQAELEAAILAHYEAEVQWSVLWAETEDSELVSAQKLTDWTALTGTLQTLLTPEQLDAYDGLGDWAFPGSGGGKGR